MLKDKITVKQGEKNKSFTKDSCSTSKTTAANAAKAMRASGKTARVIEDKEAKKFCVFVGATAKKRGGKKK